jgi:hypothetical protein
MKFLKISDTRPRRFIADLGLLWLVDASAGVGNEAVFGGDRMGWKCLLRSWWQLQHWFICSALF